ncbi:MAG TPA: enoyl-CoA hydratase/isomerase family protein [Blastocatellia bacterium]|jgi:enoyl-CoA hydratase/carnithine racemase|nr:enoyl-CoA hydratase/isomerase family protein [Blastocatellia bacterium]
MGYKAITFDLADRIATITLNRPDCLNAINTEMREDFTRLITELQTSEDIGVVIITGAGRAFSAGGDIEYFERDWNTAKFRAESRRLMQFFDELEQIEKPVLAAINGPCTGAGLQMTLSCDIRIASDRAKFGFRENNIGLIPGAGGCSRLVKLIGFGKAKELIFTGEMISAEEAERIGLVNRVVPHDELMSHARGLAEHLLTRAPEALGLAKRILWHAVNSDFQTGRTLEALAQSVLLKTADHKEGIRAFREKRKPRFKGD